MSKQKKDKKCGEEKEKKGEKEDYFHKLKVKYLNVKDLCAKKIGVKSLEVTDNSNITNLKSENATITNLVVTSTINGVDVNCQQTFNASGMITPVAYVDGDPQKPIDPTLNQTLLDALWLLNIEAAFFTEVSASSGRLRNTILNKFYDCDSCPDYDLTNCTCPIPGYAKFKGYISGNELIVEIIDTTSLFAHCPFVKGTIQIGQRIYAQESSQQFLASTIVSQKTGLSGQEGIYIIANDFNQSINVGSFESPINILSLSDNIFDNPGTCIDTPLLIYGIETIPVTRVEGNCRSLLSAIAYNINIANKTLFTRVAAVYVQVGYIDSSDNVVVQGVEIDTRQFDPSILSFGEQMNGNVLLATDLINTVAAFNGVAQLVVYVENGAQVLIPNAGGTQSLNTRDVNVAAVSNPTTNFSTSYVSGQQTTYLESGIYPVQADANGELLRVFNLQITGGGGSGGNNGSSSPEREFTGVGGGGGSGFNLQVTVQRTDAVDARYFEVLIGAGGDNTDGIRTTVTLLNQNKLPFEPSVFYVAEGGKKGGSPRDGNSNGGNGQFGGGGGAPRFGQTGGTGGIGQTVAGQNGNGQNGIPNTGGKGGNGGSSPPPFNGGKGGPIPINPNNFVGGGGGGGGSQGGNGGYFENPQGLDGGRGCGGGGSVNLNNRPPYINGGKGGAGFVTVIW